MELQNFEPKTRIRTRLKTQSIELGKIKGVNGDGFFGEFDFWGLKKDRKAKS